MPKRSIRNSYRVTLDFDERSRKYINDLQDIADLNTKAELFKQALGIFDFIATELSKGNRFKIIREDNTEQEIVFPLIIHNK